MLKVKIISRAIDFLLVGGAALLTAATVNVFAEADMIRVPGDEIRPPKATKIDLPESKIDRVDLSLFGPMTDEEGSQAKQEAQPQEISENSIYNGCAKTSLGLHLIGTLVSSANGGSYATVRRLDDRQTLVLAVGDAPDAQNEKLKVAAIRQDRIVLSNDGKVECLAFEDVELQKPAARSVAVARREPERERDGRRSKYSDFVRNDGNGQYRVDQSLIEKGLNNLNVTLRQAKVHPVETDGRKGFEFSHVKKNGIFSAIGMQKGDVLVGVNGHDLSNPEKVLDIYQRLRDAKHFEVEVIRGGKPQTLTYDLQ